MANIGRAWLPVALIALLLAGRARCAEVQRRRPACRQRRHRRRCRPAQPTLHVACLALFRCADGDDDSWQTRVHEPGYCATFGICGHRPDGDPLSCPNNTVAQPLGTPAALQKLQTVCPQLAADVGAAGGSTYCCTEQQLDQLQSQVRPLGRACWEYRCSENSCCVCSCRQDTDGCPIHTAPFPPLPLHADPDRLDLPGWLPRLQSQLQAPLLPPHLLPRPGQLCKRHRRPDRCRHQRHRGGGDGPLCVRWVGVMSIVCPRGLAALPSQIRATRLDFCPALSWLRPPPPSRAASFGERFYNSCRDVVYPVMNQKAMKFVGG